MKRRGELFAESAGTIIGRAPWLLSPYKVGVGIDPGTLDGLFRLV